MPSKKTSKKTSPKPGQDLSGKAAGKAIFPVLLLLGVIFYYYSSSFSFIQDDSYITYRYVKNFAEGHGLVFNIGERVEGYTCFLWVILLSAVKLAGINFISASRILGVISSLLVLYFTYRISSAVFPKKNDSFYILVFSLIAVVLTVSNGAFAYWANSGMETGLFAFLLTFGIYLYLRECQNASSSVDSFRTFPFSSAVFLLASITRPEGNLIFALTVLHRIIITLRNGRGKESQTGSHHAKLLSAKNMAWLLVYLVPALIYMAWRFSYYGYLFPNTFYAKTGSTLEYFQSGAAYFWDFAKNFGLYGLLFLIPVITLRDKEKFAEHLYLCMVLYVFTLYIIFIGGDVLRPARFFVPVLPVFYILFQESLHQIISGLEKKKRYKYSAAVISILVLAFSYYTYKGQYEQIKRYSELENGLVEKMTTAGQWLNSKQVSAGRPLVVAATTIGAISYFSDVILIDMLGLTDKEVAHNPQPIAEISAKTEIGWKERQYNVDYILSRKPDYIYFSTGIKPSAYAERGLFTSAEFLKYYYPSYFTVKEANFTDCIYQRKKENEAAEYKILPPNPDYKKTFVNLYNQAMNTSRDKNKFQEAINLYIQSAQQGPPNFGTPYQMIGEIYLQLKNREKAVENFQKAVQIDDYNVLSHYYLYQLFAERDTAYATESLEKVRRYSPDMLK